MTSYEWFEKHTEKAKVRRLAGGTPTSRDGVPHVERA